MRTLRLKPPYVYWFWRVYCPVVWLALVGLAFVAVIQQNERLFAGMIAYMPFFAVVVLAVLNFHAYPFEYSAFGKYRRTPLPLEQELAEIPFSWGYIGKLSTGPGLKWTLFANGIGMQAYFLGAAFVPLDEIDAIVFDGFWTATIWHHCPEVRSPIKAPKKVARLMAECYPEKIAH